MGYAQELPPRQEPSGSLIYSTEGFNLWMEGTDVEIPAKGLVRIWFRELRAEGELTRSGEPIRQAVTQRELDCDRRTIRLLALEHYGPTGTLLETWSAGERQTSPQPVAAGSLGELVWERICGPVATGGIIGSPSALAADAAELSKLEVDALVPLEITPSLVRATVPAPEAAPARVLEVEAARARRVSGVGYTIADLVREVDSEDSQEAGSETPPLAVAVGAPASQGPILHPPAGQPSAEATVRSIGTAVSGLRGGIPYRATAGTVDPSVHRWILIAGAGVLASIFVVIGTARRAGQRARTEEAAEQPRSPLAHSPIPSSISVEQEVLTASGFWEDGSGSSKLSPFQWSCRWCHSDVDDEFPTCWVCDSPRPKP
jgi:hypothetical protein